MAMFGSTSCFGDPSSSLFSGFTQPGNTSGNIFAPDPVGNTGSSAVFGGGSQSASPCFPPSMFPPPSSQAFGNTMPASGASSAPAFGTQFSQVGDFRESSGVSSRFNFGPIGNTSNNPFAPNPFGITAPFGTRTWCSASLGTSDGVYGATQSASPFPSSTPFGAPSSQAFSNILPAFGQPYAPGFSSPSSPVGFWLFVPFGSTYTPAFGAASTPTFGPQRLFGAPTTPGNTAFLRWGSRVAPYSSTTDSDNEVVQSIAAMPFYGDKTHEELRWLDYQLGNKGGSVPTGGSCFPLSSTQSNPFSPAPFNGFAPFASQTSLFRPAGSGTSSIPFTSSTSTISTSPNVFRTSPIVFPTSPNVFTTSPWSPSVYGQASFPSLFSPTATSPFEFPTPTQPSQPTVGSSQPVSSDASGVTFGRPPTPAFGSTTTSPAFGSTRAAFGSTTTSPTFGSTRAAFGVSSSPLCPSGEPFGASSTPGFGSSKSIFGTSLNPAFGSSRAPGSGSSSRPSFSYPPAPMFGQSSSTFGSSQFGASSPFGAQSSQSEADSTTFGSTGFGQSAFGGQQRGCSRVVAYTATPEPVYDGVAAGKLESIFAMQAYKDKSHEELRRDDYQLGDKGGPTPAGGSGFGMSTLQPNPLDPTSSFPRGSTSAFNTTPSAKIFTPKTPHFSSSMFAVPTPAPAPAPSSTSTVNSGLFSFPPSTAQTGGTTGLTTTPFGHTDASRMDRIPLEGRSFIASWP